MMKQNKFTALALSLFSIFLLGCSEVNHIYDSSDVLTIALEMPSNGIATRVGVSEIQGSKDLKTRWKDNDNVYVMVRRSTEMYDLGKCKVSNISQDGKQAVITVDRRSFPTLVIPFTVYCFTGITHAPSADWYSSGNWSAYCPVDLIRETQESFDAPMFCQVEVKDTDPQIGRFKHFGTYELLHLKNETDLPINAAHLGFNCDIPWYQFSTTYWFNDVDEHTKPHGEWEGDVYSPEQIIMPHSEGVFVSWYIPSGFKINNAQLVAIINDKYGVTSTNTLSSDVVLECGHAYHMYATWDGTELKFDKGGMDTPSTIKVEPTEIDFGQVPVGSSKTEYFTVSNVGGSNLTFSVINHGNEFNIPDAGTEFTLASGEERKFSVTFSSSQENHSTSSVVRILSDAENGTQYLQLKGRTYSSTSGTAILVEPMEIDFGIVPQGATKESYFTVTNIGQDDLKFTINQPSAPFSITGADTEETLVSGQSKQFAAICNGSEITGSGVQSHVNIKSNATNVEWGFGIILKATRETQDNPPVAYLTCPDDNHPHAIDLGLPSGTLWACCNVGADKPEGYGGYYAWGETEEKSCYNRETYRYYDASNETIQEIGTDIAGTNYDVAHVKWGKYWAMPTLEQWLELNHCATSWTIQDGIYGCRLTSPNGGIVFFPATGSRRNYIVEGEGTSVFLWTSEVFMLWDAQESFIFRNDKGVGASSAYRYWGCPIRPVFIQ